MILVAAAVLEKDGRILIGKRKKGDYLEGYWELPGGKIENGDGSMRECLRRELKEELGIDTRIGAFVGESKYKYPDKFQVIIRAYRAELLSGEIVLSDHSEIDWVRPEELKDYKLVDADIAIVDQLISELN